MRRPLAFAPRVFFGWKILCWEMQILSLACGSIMCVCPRCAPGLSSPSRCCHLRGLSRSLLQSAARPCHHSNTNGAARASSSHESAVASCGTRRRGLLSPFLELTSSQGSSIWRAEALSKRRKRKRGISPRTSYLSRLASKARKCAHPKPIVCIAFPRHPLCPIVSPSAAPPPPAPPDTSAQRDG